MNTSLAIRLLALCVLLSNCAEQAVEASDRIYQETYPDTLLPPSVRLHDLQFDRVVEGQSIGLHSVVVMPPSNEKAFLTIEFKRPDMHQTFIHDLYFNGDTGTKRNHPFTHRGIASVLTDERFILNIHSGVILHLRNGMEYSPDDRTFANDRVLGKVTKVQGEVFYSSHAGIKNELRWFFASIRYPDIIILNSSNSVTLPLLNGNTLTMGSPIPEPDRYPPRVVKGP